MAFKMKAGSEGPRKKNFPSAFKDRDARKIRKAKKKILKAGNKPEGGPGYLDEETGNWVFDGSNFGRKGKKAAKKLRKAGYTEEQIEDATGASGYSVAMNWANTPTVTDDHNKSARKTEGTRLSQSIRRAKNKK